MWVQSANSVTLFRYYKNSSVIILSIGNNMSKRKIQPKNFDLNLDSKMGLMELPNAKRQKKFSKKQRRAFTEKLSVQKDPGQLVLPSVDWSLKLPRLNNFCRCFWLPAEVVPRPTAPSSSEAAKWFFWIFMIAQVSCLYLTSLVRDQEFFNIIEVDWRPILPCKLQEGVFGYKTFWAHSYSG